MSSRDLFYKQAPAPVTISKPTESGELVVVKTIAHPVERRYRTDYENEHTVYRYRLVAIQETGEEMYAGRARFKPEAYNLKALWLQDHPEHRDVRIEEI